ncbi:hypothetical protein PG995_014287 [Apiospora arundinis]
MDTIAVVGLTFNLPQEAVDEDSLWNTQLLPHGPFLLVWTAADEQALQRMILEYQAYYQTRIAGYPDRLDSLSCTLDLRRSHLIWRTFSITENDTEAISRADQSPAPFVAMEPVRSSSESLSIAFIFTGQGAQYTNMGLDLLRYPVFAYSLQKSEEVFRSLGSTWSLTDALGSPNEIDSPERSQPLCTALQLALVDLLRSFSIVPEAVIGHSSGEIAAAYTIGALSFESACKVAYYRGIVAGKIRISSAQSPAGMMSVNLSEPEVYTYLDGVRVPRDTVDISCINSPINCTLSGSAATLDRLKSHLDSDGIFAHMLKTGIAYHSPAMTAAASEYISCLGLLEPGLKSENITMVSSVTGEPVSSHEILSDGQYWVDNLVSQVKFSSALQRLADGSSLRLGMEPITDFIEVGPHAALRRPTKDTLASVSSKGRYHCVLQRPETPSYTILRLVGHLFSFGHMVSVAAANRHDASTRLRPLVDCPRYPFDHTRKYWAESRISKNYRLQPVLESHLLGKRNLDWNTARPSFRNWLSVEVMPWLADHVVNGIAICPGTGMIVMAIEAAKYLESLSASPLSVSGFILKEAQFLLPIPVSEDAQSATETCLYMRPMQNQHGKKSTKYEISIFAHRHEHWSECFRTQVEVQYCEETAHHVGGGRETTFETERIRNCFRRITDTCDTDINAKAFYKFLCDGGWTYGPAFQLLQQIKWDRQGMSTAQIDMGSSICEDGVSPVHPATLDAVAHLILAQVTQGMSQATPTIVPHRLSQMWISSQVWSRSGSSIRLASVVQETNRLGVKASIYAVADDDTPLCAVEHISMVPVSRDNLEDDPNEAMSHRLVYEMEWKPQLSSLRSRELQQYICVSSCVSKSDYALPGIREMDAALTKAASHAIQEVSKDKATYGTMTPDHLKRFMESIKHLQIDDGSSHSSSEIEALLEECARAEPALNHLRAIGRALVPILRGDADALELMFANNVDAFYASSFQAICNAQFQSFLDLASHETPALRILEVGAGTGSMTGCVLSALESLEQKTGTCRFSEYTYTDISPTFFKAASERFSAHVGRMVFRKLDLNCNPSDQGFQLGTYDIVVAGSVLHATPRLSSTLAHLRALLKPNGHLVNAEITKRDCISVVVGFGALPGWWLATEAWRQDGPLVTEDKWHELLQDSGFSGIDLCERIENPGLSLMVSTASEEATASYASQETHLNSQQAGLVLVTDSGHAKQRALVVEFQKLWPWARIVQFDDLPNITWAETDVVVSLIEVGTPNLPSQNLLWITGPAMEEAGKGVSNPQYGVAAGFLRTIRSEEPTKRIVLVIVLLDDNTSPEVEFIIRGGLLNIGRLAHSSTLEDHRRGHVQPQLRSQRWLPGPAVTLDVGTPGMLNTLCFIEDTDHYISQGHADTAPLSEFEVEMEAKCWPVSFRDLFIALGQLGAEGLGCECAGVVTRAGSMSNFSPGDRVCMVVPGHCMRTYVRAPAEAVFKLPDTVSFHNAVAAVNPGMTAYQALVNVARLQRGERILIHSAAGATGQMAMWIAKYIGADIYATVGSESKKEMIINRFGIDPEHVFYSRNSTFAQGIKRITNSCGVDVVLNSLSGEMLQASWDCIAPYGRFVEIGKMDIGANASLPMARFAKNVSFCAVDLYHIIQTNSSLARSLTQAVIDLIAEGKACNPTPLRVFPVTEIEQAFRLMQSGKNVGRVIIDVQHDHIVPKLARKKSDWVFSPNASYLVAGGFGGLGRAILRWMAEKGAKHFIVPSRSGMTSQATLEVAEHIRNRGGKIVASQCHTGSTSDLAKLLRECADAGLPPIKGCINAAMDLQDSIFEGMTHAKWERSIIAKVNTSWNLHQQLPNDLDFFILLSSLSGIYGSLAQSNYAAGCTFQDSLAQYRNACGIGKVSVSLDLGWVRDAGIVAETELYRRNRNVARDMNPVDAADIVALLDLYCDPTTAYKEAQCPGSQVLVGAVTPADLPDSEELRMALKHLPMLSGFALAAANAKSNKNGAAHGVEHGVSQPAVLFRQASDARARASVVVDFLVAKLARALGVTEDDINRRRPLSECGVDSLMAIELRNWFKHDFGAAVAVFEIMDGGVHIADVGKLVVDRAVST